LKPRRGEKRDNWLLIKSDDPAARRSGDILEDAPQSVKSGLTIDEIGKNGKADIWHSDKPAGGESSARKVRTKKTPRSGKEAAMPDFVPPCLATLQSAPPAGDEWLHEVKFDGYRVQARLSGGRPKLLTRKGLDWSDRFGKEIADALGKLECGNAILDGEIVVLADTGISSFSALQAALSEGHTEKLIFYVFDLLFLDGEDVSGEPLADRKERLSELLKPLGDGEPVRYSEHFTEPGKTMLAHACRMGLEGVVSKRADARYHSGRGHDWIKSKCTQRQEFVIAGYLPSEKTGRGLRSLIVGYNEGGELKSAGHVGTGFSAKVGDDLKKKLDRLKRKASPLTGAGSKEKGAVWVSPDLVAEVEFRSWTADRILRHASFQGLREDKPAHDVVVEEPEDSAKGGGKKASKKGAPKRASVNKGARTSLTLTHPDKLLWPEAGITKQGLLDYYEEVWPLMEQFVAARPLALVRAPDGVGGPRFFQKHASPGMHEKILRKADAKDGEELLYIEDFDGLAALVQNGVVEIHIWGSKIGSIEKPDQIIFDLDPDEGLDVGDVRKATLDVHSRLDELGMPNFVKTSGGKGFHVVVPLKPKADWERVKTFAHDFARAMEQASPERYTATLSKKARAGRIFIDYLRNGRGSTTVAPYSSRGKPNATVSMPIDWKALEGKVGPADYTIGDTRGRAGPQKADTWHDFFKRAPAPKLG
jgi:bifunctional non-homologous end joining protein LigD